MSEYEKYVKEVNNIFALLEKLKNSWNNNDNLAHIEQIYEYRKVVIQGADYLEKENRNKDMSI